MLPGCRDVTCDREHRQLQSTHQLAAQAPARPSRGTHRTAAADLNLCSSCLIPFSSPDEILQHELLRHVLGLMHPDMHPVMFCWVSHLNKLFMMICQKVVFTNDEACERGWKVLTCRRYLGTTCQVRPQRSVTQPQFNSLSFLPSVKPAQKWSISS